MCLRPLIAWVDRASAPSSTPTPHGYGRASGRTLRRKAAASARSDSRLTPSRSLSRGSRRRTRFQALRTVRPQKIPTTIFHDRWRLEPASRLTRQRNGGGSQRPHPCSAKAAGQGSPGLERSQGAESTELVSGGGERQVAPTLNNLVGIPCHDPPPPSHGQFLLHEHMEFVHSLRTRLSQSVQPIHALACFEALLRTRLCLTRGTDGGQVAA